MLKQKKINFKYKLGFTLVELLITVTILGILSTVAYVGVGEIRKTIRDNKRRADLNQVARALELFKADYGQYPVNNYYSTAPSGAESLSLMPFLKDGGTLDFFYPGGEVLAKPIVGSYLKEYMRDPINEVGASSWAGSMYVYYGSQWGNWPQTIQSLMPQAFLSNMFPMQCPGGSGDCGPNNCVGLVDAALEACLILNWEDCCNTGGCYDPYCEYADGSVSFTDYSLNGLSNLCYGPGTTRSLSLLMARLEKESKLEERINNVFAFCPTADPSHPYHADFVKLKRNFPRGKDCYDGSSYACSDPEDVSDDGGNWAAWSLNDYNYFVPLTGEFNLR